MDHCGNRVAVGLFGVYSTQDLTGHHIKPVYGNAVGGDAVDGRAAAGVGHIVETPGGMYRDGNRARTDQRRAGRRRQCACGPGNLETGNLGADVGQGVDHARPCGRVTWNHPGKAVNVRHKQVVVHGGGNGRKRASRLCLVQDRHGIGGNAVGIERNV